MAEIRAKKKLEEITARFTGKITADQIIALYKNQQPKFTNDKLFKFLQDYIKPHILDGDKLVAQYENNTKKLQKTSYEALIIMLNNATVVQQQTKPPIAEKPNLNKLSVKSEGTFESPALSSTRYEPNAPEILVSEIKERLAQVTQQQNTSRQSLRPSLNTSGNAPKAVVKKEAPKIPMISMVNPISVGTFVFTGDILLPFQKIPKPIAGLPAAEQEIKIITDLLYTLVGINADLISPKLHLYKDETTMNLVHNWLEHRRPDVEFHVDEHISDSVKDILKDILPLANLYCQLQLFIEYARARDSGQVLQALSEACGNLVGDYITTISQLEALHNRRELNLQKMLFLLRPIIQTMETVVTLCMKLQDNNIRGGNVLTMLHDNIALFSGDKSSQKIIIHLTQKAAVPYMEILSLWIFKGIVHDARQEFFVEDHVKDLSHDCYLDEFWEKRFVLSTERVPRFLEKQADVILRTGKYLNVIRECGKRITFNHPENLKFSHTDEQSYVSLINDAYTFASKACMELIMDEYDLMGHLLSVKRYFLLQQGDFIVQYLDACEQELSKGVDDVMPISLENLLELTLRMSSAKFDKYQDNLSTNLMPFDIVTQMTKINKSTGSESDDEYDLPDTSTLSGIECFTFNYTTNWPISIVLHQMTISKYQIIFRQLFYCKYVENYLCRVWLGNNNAKKFDLETSEQYRAAFTLRQRMMNTIQNLEYYMMIEVIEPVWLVFMQQITKAKNIDEVLFYHEDFLDHCLKNCLLCLTDVLKIIIKICNLCIDFCKFIEEAQRHFIDAELSSMLSQNYLSDDNLCHLVDDQQKDAKPETFSEKVARFDSVFTQTTVSLLIKIQQIAEKAHSEKFVSLIHRINFNNFYSDKLTSTE